jgi:ribonucrease Y
MTWLDRTFLEGALLLATGWAGGYWLFRWRDKKLRLATNANKDSILENARREAQMITREARLASTEEALKLRDQTEKAFAARSREIGELERRLGERELLINGQLEGVVQQEKAVCTQKEQLERSQAAVEAERGRLRELAEARMQDLQKLGRLTEAEARTLILKEVEQQALRDASDVSRHIVESARNRAEEEARRIISLAIQRYAGSHTFETTTATVALQGDEIKGRIIGREGRNIRAFESATGVTVLIDDTPNAVVLSGFDPVRREIAREAMQRLILDGRIHPTRIEEVVAKVSEEMDETILKAAEEAVYKVGLTPMPVETMRLLGRLRFRHSFSQNILEHSVEVAHLAGLMAAELGVEIAAAKRAGLLHDIGKALDHEVEGSHAMIGAEFVRRHGESEDVVNGIASHHDERPHTNLLGIIVSAADAISASRPGARSETMTTYIKRLEHLEQIGLSFPGVDRCFAVQAGRELRVIVHPDQVDDAQSESLARSLARKIEDELHYPGQIRVTVVRETRCVEYAK